MVVLRLVVLRSRYKPATATVRPRRFVAGRCDAADVRLWRSVVGAVDAAKMKLRVVGCSAAAG